MISTVAVGVGPLGAGMTKDGSRIYIACHNSNVVASNQVVKTISIGRGAGSHGVSFASEGKLLLITNTGASTVSVIDTERDEILRTIKVAVAPEGIAFKRP